MKETTDDLKRAAAVHAVDQLKNGMVVGLSVTGIPTSEKTAEQARALGIPLATLGEFPVVDMTIDGADEVELGTLNLIKGGGGNHLREKLVAVASKELLIIVDQSKLVKQLGSRAPVPVEVAQFGWLSTERRLAALGTKPVLRMNPDGTIFLTDGGNYILDCFFGPVKSATELQAQLDATVGVIEHGLFVGIASRVVVGLPGGGVQVLGRN
jgi:ribose 5-phosphate isomerase A